ncbi:protein YgfX [Frischella perrara]|uniref:protein YgfX n=1 Tax=Frischella perrara TaxID=1267021 RepID=UPI0023F4AE1C|nr:protein YgfX [Frischella perrara]MCT6874766.1 protein YgfX [Frischella perrara]
MWNSQLKVSQNHFMAVSLFYVILLITLMMTFYQTQLDTFTMLAVLLLVLEWWRALRYFMMIRGELALFYDNKQLYWSRQRWYVVKPPLYLYFLVVINLQSIRNGKQQLLILIFNNLTYRDWRSLNYYLRQFYSR